MPTEVFCCGAECGVNAAGGAGATPHWSTFNATVTVDTATVRGNGSTRSYKFTTAATKAQLLHLIAGSPTVLVGRCWVNWTTLPAADWAVFGGVASTQFGIAIKSTGQLVGFSGATFGTLGPTIGTGEWHLIEFVADIHANPWTLDWSVDGAPQTQFTAANVASTFTSAGFDPRNQNSTQTFYADDIAFSVTAADYPLGSGTVVRLGPTRDGTHSFTTNDFEYNDVTGIASTATDVYTYLDDLLDNVTDFIAVVVGTASVRYIQIGFGSVPDGRTIQGVEVVSAHHSASTQANQQSMRINDGGTRSTLLNNVDLSNTGITYHTQHFATAPSSGTAWTKAQVDALLLEWGNIAAAVQDVAPVPYIDAACLEVDLLNAYFRPVIIVAPSQAAHHAAGW